MTENDEVQNAPESGAADEPTELTDKPKKAALTAEELGHILMFRHQAKLEERQASRLRSKSDGTVKPEEPKSRSASKRRAAKMAWKTQEAENVQNVNISAESDGQAQEVPMPFIFDEISKAAEPETFSAKAAETAPRSDFRPPPNSEQPFSASAEDAPVEAANSDIWEQNQLTDAPPVESPKQTNAENPIPSAENAAPTSNNAVSQSKSLLQTNAEAAPDKVKAAPVLKHEPRPRLKEKQRLSEVPEKAPAETEKPNAKRQKKPVEQKQTDEVKQVPDEAKSETVSAVEDAETETETEQTTVLESVSENTPTAEQTKPMVLRHDPRSRLKEKKQRLSEVPEKTPVEAAKPTERRQTPNPVKREQTETTAKPADEKKSNAKRKESKPIKREQADTETKPADEEKPNAKRQESNRTGRRQTETDTKPAETVEPSSKRQKPKPVKQDKTETPTKPDEAKKSAPKAKEAAPQNTPEDMTKALAKRHETRMTAKKEALPPAEVKPPSGKAKKKERGEPKREPIRLNFDDEVEPGKPKMSLGASGRLVGRAVGAVTATAVMAAHRKIYETENENAAVKGADRSELMAEGAVRSAARGYNRNAAKRRERLQNESHYVSRKHSRQEGKDGSYSFEGKGTEVKRSSAHEQQKKRIKRDYQLAARAKARGNTSAASKNAKAAVEKADKVKDAVISFVKRHKGLFLTLAGFGAVLLLLLVGLGSCSSMFAGVSTPVVTTTYPSDDRDIKKVEEAYSAYEDALEDLLDNIPHDYPGYASYTYYLDPIYHDPYCLISYFTVKYGDFTYNDVKDELAEIERLQYKVSLYYTVETIEYTETVYQGDPPTPVEVVRYVDIYHLHIYLDNNDLDSILRSRMSEDEQEMYDLYNTTHGNRDGLFD